MLASGCPAVFAYVKSSLMPAAKYDSRTPACQSVSDGLLGKTKQNKKERVVSFLSTAPVIRKSGVLHREGGI
jgi:hypothetical protein